MLKSLILHETILNMFDDIIVQKIKLSINYNAVLFIE